MPRSKYLTTMPNDEVANVIKRTVIGYRANLTGAINACDNGAYVELDLTVARQLQRICVMLESLLDASAVDKLKAPL